jgi:RHS repeat-associated protein
VGSVATPFNTDQWTLSLRAGQQIRLELLAQSGASLRYTLEGPGGYRPIDSVSGATGPVTIANGQSGNYVLSVAGLNGQTGSYRFELSGINVFDLPLATTTTQTLVGAGSAVAFEIESPGDTPLFIEFDHSVNTDRTEVYLRRGSVPSRGTFDYRFDAVGADHNLLVQNAPAGTWYVLVYGDRIAATSEFTIRATADQVYLFGSTPDQIGASSDVTMTVTGAGFRPGLVVELVRGATVVAAQSVSVDSFDRATAMFDLTGVAPEVFDVRVRTQGGQSDTLPGALTVTPAGVGRLETRIIAPPNLGRHEVATILVGYGNVGNAPIPAPMIQLRSGDPDDSDRPILTLDQSLLSQGFWTFNLPEGFSHSVSFLGSGEQPGVLNPGEWKWVPVYYAGLLQPWDFGDTRVELGLTAILADEDRPMNWAGVTYASVEDNAPYLPTPGNRGPGLPIGGSIPDPRFGVYDVPWQGSVPPSAEHLRQSLGLGPGDRVLQRWDEPGVVQLRPDSVSPAAWTAIIENLRANVGNTLGDWIRALSENAQFLARSGIVTNDLTELWSFEVMQAMGSLGPVSTLDAVTDAAMPVPGIGLSVARSFSNGIVSRYTTGPFGQGWSMGWDLQLTEESGPTPQLRGSVVLAGSTGQLLVFEPDARDLLGRKYFSPTGFNSTLTKLSSGLFELRDQDGTVTRFRADGRIDYVQDPNSNRVTTTFDADRLTELTHSSGASITLTYNPAGRITQVADSAGRATTYTYDPTNTYLLTVTTHDGKVTTYTYNQTGSPQVLHALRSISRGGTTQFLNYDSQGRLDDTFRGNNQQFIDFVYDSAGTVSVIDAAGTTRLFYQQDGLLARVTDPLGNTTVSRYDDSYRLNAVIAPTGENQSFTWTTTGQLSGLTDELGNRTSFIYDNPFKRMTSFTDALGRTTRYSYDPRGNLQQTTYPNGSRETLTGYDAQGLPTSFTNRRGQAQRYTYTPSGQIDRQTFADGSYADFDYDIRGNLILVTEVGPGGTGTPEVTIYTYDYAASGDRLKRVTNAEGRWVEFAYDNFGRRIAMTDSTGAVTRYEYDSAGRLHRLRDGANTLLVTYTYDAAGRLSRVEKGNGTFTTYGYDPAGQLLRLINYRDASTINSHFDYTYDARGRRTTMTTLDGAWTYTYDATGQLTRAVFASANTSLIPNQDLQYVYDAVGNRIRTILNGVTTEYTTNNLNQYTNVGGQAYTYDADGNLTFDGQRTYVYDQQSRLVRVTGPAGVTEYEYDAIGNRTATIHNGVRTEYLLDPTGLVDVTAEFDGGGNLTARNVHGLGFLGRSIEGGSLNYFDFDAIGSTAGVTGAAGQMLNRYAYEPFGGSLFRSENLVNPFQYVGEFGLRTALGGHVEIRARDYQIETGAFLQKDPSGLYAPTLYSYGANNPVSFIDIDGLSPRPINPGFQRGPWRPPPRVVPRPDLDPHNLSGRRTRSRKDFWGGIGDALDELPKYLEGPKVMEFRVPAPGERVFRPRRRIYVYHDKPVIVNPDTEVVRINSIFDFYLNFGDFQCPRIPPGDVVSIVGRNSVDPNDKLGPQGVGPQNFVRGDATLPYRIRFENIGPGSINPATNEPFPQFRWASAPAQRVTILDQLSPLLDWSSFRLAEFGFGDTIISVPPDRNYFETVRSVTIGGVTFNVELIAGVDLETGRVYATYQSLDPATGLPPNVLNGFLPPEDGSGNGMGYFAFTIQPVAGLATGTEIRNVALISFDGQNLIATNQADPFDPASASPDREARITIDATPPTVVIDDVTPPSGPRPPAKVTLRFSEAVTGVDPADLRLTRDGVEVPLNEASLASPDDGVTWELGNFALFGSARGNYVLSLRGDATVTDLVGNAMNASPATGMWTVVASSVVGRHVFYNNSSLDGGSSELNTADDGAIATDKLALLPGQAASFANYTSYAKGLNGIMIDLTGIPGLLTTDDFEFRVGNDNNPGAWPLLLSLPNGTFAGAIRTLATAGGNDRLSIAFPDGLIKGKWLRVLVKANDRTGLAVPDVFYFGNAPGDSGLGNTATHALVNATDQIAARNNPTTTASATNPYDYNRDGKVDALDETVARNNGTTVVNALKLFTTPAAPKAGGGRVTGGLVDGGNSVTAQSVGRTAVRTPPVRSIAFSSVPIGTSALTGKRVGERDDQESLIEALPV